MRWQKTTVRVDTGRIGRRFAIAGFALFLGACGPIAVSLDYDPRIDFERYATFDWLDNRPGAPAEARAAMARDASFSMWVRQGVGRELAARGLTEDPISPDLLVIWHFGQNEKIDVRPFGYAYAAQYGGWGGAIDAQYYREGALVLDLVDARTMWLVWRGAATRAKDDKATAGEAETQAGEAVKKLLSKYPPK